MKRALTVVAATGVLAPPGVAGAATVGLEALPDGSQRLTYRGELSEANDLVVRDGFDPAYPWGDARLFSDAGAPLTAGEGCIPTTPIACEPREAYAFLGDGDDRASYLSFMFDGLVWGGDGNDDIHSDGLAAYASGDEGDDRLRVTSNGDSEAHGGPGDDFLTGSGVSGLSLFGGPGDDEIEPEGTEFGNRYEGGDGNDAIVLPNIEPGTGLVSGGPGADKVTFAATDSEAAGEFVSWSIDTGAGHDRIHGGRVTVEEINSGAGYDVIDVRGGGSDIVVCGRGFDLVMADAGDSVARDCELRLRRGSRPSRL
jgi:hypothetical protein